MRWVFHCGRRMTHGPSLALGVEVLVHDRWGVEENGAMLIGPSPQISFTFLRWFVYFGVMFPLEEPEEGPVAIAAPKEPIGPAPMPRDMALRGDY